MNHKTKPYKPSSILSKTLIIMGLLVAVVTILLVRMEAQTETTSESGAAIRIVTTEDATSINGIPTTTGETPASQWKYAIVNEKPTLAFFHSNTCKSCLQMIDTVNEVYPEFSKQVILIDVDVYDPQNEDLIYRVGINFIPTLVFYNNSGDSLFSIGVISSKELRQKLNDISPGKIP